MKKEKLSVIVIFSENILEKQANRSLNRYIFSLFPIKRGYNAMPQKIDYVELTFQNSKLSMCHPFRVPAAPFIYYTGVYTPAWGMTPLQGSVVRNT